MEQFIVSARKYRPDTFESVVGQEHVTNTLKNAIRNNHLAQAFLFCGPRGVGKTTCARILAKTINCENLKDSIEPCNECNSCTTFNKNSSFNIYELDAASNNSVDDIRALVDQVRYAPQGAKYKIYIIDEVHMLSTAAFNAFLKTLEEPPPYAIFILATTERHKILPTILSRCQIFDFNRITIPSMVKHLQGISGKEQIVAEEQALHIIAEKADGALRDALSIFDQMVSFSGSNLTYSDVIQNLNILDYDYYFKTCDLVYNEEISEALLLLDEVVRKGFDAHLFLGGLCDHFRNLLVSKSPETVKLLEVAEAAAQRYAEQAARIEKGFILNALNLAVKFDASYKSARNTRLHVELALIKLAQLRRLLQINMDSLSSDSLGEKKKANPELSQAKPTASPQPTSNPTPVSTPTPAAPVLKPEEKKVVEAPKVSLPKIDLKLGAVTNPNTENSSEDETAKQESGPVIQFELNQESLQKLWISYASEMEKQNKMGLSVGMRKSTIKLNDRRLTATVVGRHVFDFITEVKQELMAWLNARLTTTLDSFDMVVENKEDEDNIIYTMEEKRNVLAQNYPEFAELIKKLGLELDY
ncbi:MAG: DNA polymerase III subunit gamma/tau [Bacteroidetes bacterium]|nr:MAG: DNA polymerase III subunit gamma/tau [Bacteroidota bacterium]